MTETQTLTLTEFLLARIAEVEDVARAVPEVEAKSGTAVFTSLAEPTGTVEMSLARVLAECEAKRLIVQRAIDRGRWDRNGVRRAWDNAYLLDLATAYRDHSDYRDEWRA